jgi:Protein of unknown function DUF47
LMPRHNVFFPVFERHAAVIVRAARALREMVVDGDQLKLHFQEVIALEHEADSIAREVLLGLRTTFITPFDRDDIQSLITSMDDSVDQCKQTAKAITLFEVTMFEPYCRCPLWVADILQRGFAPQASVVVACANVVAIPPVGAAVMTARLYSHPHPPYP